MCVCVCVCVCVCIRTWASAGSACGDWARSQPGCQPSTPEASPQLVFGAHPSCTFMDVKLVVIPAAPPIVQVQLHRVVEIHPLEFPPLPTRGRGAGSQRPRISQPAEAYPPTPGAIPPFPFPPAPLRSHMSPQGGASPPPPHTHSCPPLKLWALTLSSGGSKSALRM